MVELRHWIPKGAYGDDLGKIFNQQWDKTISQPCGLPCNCCFYPPSKRFGSSSCSFNSMFPCSWLRGRSEFSLISPWITCLRQNYLCLTFLLIRHPQPAMPLPITCRTRTLEVSNIYLHSIKDYVNWVFSGELYITRIVLYSNNGFVIFPRQSRRWFLCRRHI